MAGMQWNGKFRDDVRAFVRGEPGKVGALMQRLYGSDDLFPDGLEETCRPYQSVNFVTAHDGFCLYDLVAYDAQAQRGQRPRQHRRHRRQPELELRREGDANAPPAVLALRRQQAKNVCALLMLANGIPMIVAGDEFLEHAARQQQSLQPGQRHRLARLVATRTATATFSASSS